MPPVIAAVVAIAAKITIVGIVKAVVGAVISAGLSMAAGALASKKKPKAFGSVSDLGREITQNISSTVAFIPVVYGRHKVGGLRVYTEVSSTKLFMVNVFCEGEIQSIDEIYIDGVISTDSKFSGKVDLYTFTGADDQSVSGWTHVQGSGAATFIAAGAPGWTSNHRVRGCAGVAAVFTKNTDVFPQIPEVTAVVKGRKVYDPRDGTTAYSQNNALCIRDYYLNARFGARIGSSRIDEASFQAAANFFEEQADYGNGNQDRFLFNGIIDTSQRVWDNIEDMMLACNSLPKRVNGKHGILPLKAETTAFTFTDANVVSGISVERLGKRFKKNKINCSFINPDNNWQPDLVIEDSATYLAQDNSITLTNELELRGVTDRYQAGYTAQVALRQSRLEKKYHFKAMHEALKVEIGDVVSLTHTLYGFSSELMRVTALSIEPDGSIGVDAEEYDEDVYDIDSVDAAVDGNSTTFASPFTIDAPGTPIIAETYSTTSAGFIVNVVTLTWSAPVSAQVGRYIVEYRTTGATDWIKIGEPKDTTFILNDVVAGTYDFAVSAINTVGTVSERSTRTSVNVYDDTSTPDDITGFTYETTTNNQIVLKWTRNDDVFRGGYYRIKVSNALSGATWADFPQVNLLVDGRQNTVTLPILQGTYLIKAEQLSGVQSSNAASFTLLLPDHDEWVAVSTVTESTTFSGTHSGSTSSTGTLTLAASSSGGLNTSATYTWGNQIDLGGTFAARLTRVSSGTLSNSAANWDSFGSNMDDYTSVLIDDMAGNSTIDVKHYFATSTQSSTGTFTAYNQLQMAETVGRYIKFQTTIESGANTENVNIQELAATAWLKRRTESGYNASVSSSGGTITFAYPFYATPNISVMPFNGTAGQYVTATTSQASRTSFAVAYFTSSGGQTSGKISWSAYGHGKETT